MVVSTDRSTGSLGEKHFAGRARSRHGAAQILRYALGAVKGTGQSAVEAIVDKASPEFHELAGRAKDMGSAAVFVLMVNVFLCWGLILGSR